MFGVIFGFNLVVKFYKYVTFLYFSLARLKSLALIGLFAMATGVSNGLSAQAKPATSKENPAPTMGVR